MLLSGKVAIITGGSRGLGKAICLAYADEGAHVVTCARSSGTLKEVQRELAEITPSYLVRQADVTKVQDVQNLVEDSLAQFHRIDVLVNNASILGPRVEIVEYPEEEWRKVVEVNLFGAFLVAREVARQMMKQRSGSIINITSSVGRHGRAKWGAYSAAKFGVEGLTQILAEELKDYNVRVNSVNPGAMPTDMRRAAYPEEDQSKLRRIEEILDVFLYLASDESQGHSGGTFDAQTFVKPA